MSIVLEIYFLCWIVSFQLKTRLYFLADSDNSWSLNCLLYRILQKLHEIICTYYTWKMKFNNSHWFISAVWLYISFKAWKQLFVIIFPRRLQNFKNQSVGSLDFWRFCYLIIWTILTSYKTVYQLWESCFLQIFMSTIFCHTLYFAKKNLSCSVWASTGVRVARCSLPNFCNTGSVSKFLAHLAFRFITLSKLQFSRLICIKGNNRVSIHSLNCRFWSFLTVSYVVITVLIIA